MDVIFENLSLNHATMAFTVYLICTALIQLSSAQVLSYIQRNSMPQAVETTARYVSNVANTVNSGITTPSNTMTIARVPTTVPVASNSVVTNANVLSPASNPNLANANIANINAVNAVANQNIASSNYVANQNANYAANGLASNAANYANAANLNAANAAASNAVNYVNAYANQNLAASTTPLNPVNAASNVVNANLNNAALGNAALANAALANINGNTATFNLGTNGNTFTVTSGSPGAQGFGISVIADALEVGGTVAVNGQIPIFGTVAVNGNVPTDGAATVSYNCGGKQVPVIV